MTLISTDMLSARLPNFVVIDCRFKLDDVAWGEREFAAGHIPGAVYAHLDRDLSGPKTGTNGRHPLPDAQTFATTLGRLGVANDAQVVAYDQDNGMYASRLWWMLRWLGHDAVAVLDGGFAKWTAENRPTASGREMRPAGVHRPGTVGGPGRAAGATRRRSPQQSAGCARRWPQAVPRSRPGAPSRARPARRQSARAGAAAPAGV